MTVQPIIPRPELRSLIDMFYFFESETGIPAGRASIVAPNGKPKFIYTYKNRLSTVENGIQTDYRNEDILFIGVWDKPVQLSTSPEPTGTIGIELSPRGLHRFTRLPADEIANKIYSFSDIYGPIGERLKERLANTSLLPDKIHQIEIFLLQIISMTNRSNQLIDFSFNCIEKSKGILSIKELEKKTGYSKRYLDLLFRNHIGISPKTLAGITRFQTLYQLWANSKELDFYTGDLYSFYYDQAHFIKEFRRFTGHSPRQYAVLNNEFGKLFYRHG